MNQSAISGQYDIWLESTVLNKTVYCYFDHVKKEAWTLVMSYSYSYQNIMDVLPFFKDNPINENTPSFNYYRASLSLMKQLRNESSFWRATCNHDTKPRDDDFMQSNFSTLDIITLTGKVLSFYISPQSYGGSSGLLDLPLTTEELVWYGVSAEGVPVVKLFWSFSPDIVRSSPNLRSMCSRMARNFGYELI